MINYTVDSAFIKEAHEAACDVWKKKIEAKFPELFPRFSIQEVIDKFGRSVHGRSIEFSKIFLKIPIPNANNEWDVKIMEYVSKVLKEYPKAYVNWSKIIAETTNNDYFYINFTNYIK